MGIENRETEKSRMDVLSLYAAFLSKSAGNSGNSAEEKPEPVKKENGKEE